MLQASLERMVSWQYLSSNNKEIPSDSPLIPFNNAGSKDLALPLWSSGNFLSASFFSWLMAGRHVSQTQLQIFTTLLIYFMASSCGFHHIFASQTNMS